MIFLTERLDVENIIEILQRRYFYLETLRNYITWNYPEGPKRFQCFLWVLIRLSELKKLHLESLQPLANELTPFLKEIWDIGKS